MKTLDFYSSISLETDLEQLDVELKLQSETIVDIEFGICFNRIALLSF